MTHRYVMATLAVAGIGILGDLAIAQDPVPLRRTVSAPAAIEGQQAAANENPGTGSSALLGSLPPGFIPYRGGGARDRFGNAIRGDRCEDHWANCAYDPDNPVPSPMRARQ